MGQEGTGHCSEVRWVGRSVGCPVGIQSCAWNTGRSKWTPDSWVPKSWLLSVGPEVTGSTYILVMGAVSCHGWGQWGQHPAGEGKGVRVSTAQSVLVRRGQAELEHGVGEKEASCVDVASRSFTRELEGGWEQCGDLGGLRT